MTSAHARSCGRLVELTCSVFADGIARMVRHAVGRTRVYGRCARGRDPVPAVAHHAHGRLENDRRSARAVRSDGDQQATVRIMRAEGALDQLVAR